MTEKKKYNETLLPFWNTRAEGRLMSIVVSPEHYDAFQKVEVGGRLTFKVLNDDSRKNEKSPNAYLEYISKTDVEAYKAKGGGAGAAAELDI